MGGGPTVSSNIGRICSETIFQKVFIRIARTGRVFRGEVGNERTLSLSLARKETEIPPKPNTAAIRRDVNL